MVDESFKQLSRSATASSSTTWTYQDGSWLFSDESGNPSPTDPLYVFVGLRVQAFDRTLWDANIPRGYHAANASTSSRRGVRDFLTSQEIDVIVTPIQPNSVPSGIPGSEIYGKGSKFHLETCLGADSTSAGINVVVDVPPGEKALLQNYAVTSNLSSVVKATTRIVKLAVMSRQECSGVRAADHLAWAIRRCHLQGDTSFLPQGAESRKLDIRDWAEIEAWVGSH